MRFPVKDGLSLSVAAQNVNNLVTNHALESVTGIGKILAGIKMIGMLNEMLAQHSGESKTKVTVNINLADGTGGSLAELILRNTDGIRKLSTEFVDDLYEFLGNGGSRMPSALRVH